MRTDRLRSTTPSRRNADGASNSSSNGAQRSYPRGRPLNLAAAHGQLSTVALLIDYGAELNPEDGTPPLTAAAESGHTGVVRLLLQRGAGIDRKDSMTR